ncbi:outer membrane beta-barrel protein [Devosia sp. Root105]|uniref:outer membrane protein n=1 Tax=Devosia sp. Root105 TaxID=1736423 RepID=UPI0018D25DB2|nr:outer membrane beta-barrel protein [Devosia sp. Root105]
MRILTGTLLGALLSTTALPAFAADLIIEETPIAVLPVVGSSTGFYVGAHLGPTIIGVDYDPDVDPPELYQFSKPSLTAGIAFGWDTMLGSNLVGGIELRYDLFNAAFSPYEDALGADLYRFQDTLSLTGKLGYLVAPGTQVYGVLGFGSAGFSAFAGLDDETGRASGLVVGVGAETRLTDLLSATVDVRYFSAFDEYLVSNDTSFLPRYLAVTAGLKFRFDDGLGHMVEDPTQIDFDFTGPNVSVSALAVAASMERDILVPGADTGPFWSEGVGVGIGLGYDFDIGNGWVIGATANLDYTPLVFDDAAGNSPDVDAPTKFATVDTVISAGARLGFKTNPSTLVYGKLAIAGINTHANEEFFALDGGGSALLPAVQLGLGVETAIADQVTLGVEGNYTAATSPLVVNNSQPEQVDLWPTLLTGKVTLKYHF